MEDSDNIRYNSRIRVLEKHGEKHEGIVEFFDRSNGRLVLKNVLNLNKNKHTCGQITIFYKDIESFEIVNQSSSQESLSQLRTGKSRNSESTITGGLYDLENKITAFRYSERSSISGYSQFTNRNSMSSDGFVSISDETIINLKNDDKARNLTSNQADIFYDNFHSSALDFKTSFNENAHSENKIDLSSYNHIVLTDYTSSAIIIRKNFTGCKTLYLRLFSNKSGYNQKLSILSVQINDFTYIFDMISIEADEENGQQKVMELLKPFITSPDVKKIVYNNLEQKMVHKFDIELNTVFDIKESCKKIYLNLSENELKFESLVYHLLPDVEVDKANLDESDMDWNTRPLTRIYKYFVIRNTACLFDLHMFLKEKIFEKWCNDTTLKLNKNKQDQNSYEFEIKNENHEYTSLNVDKDVDFSESQKLQKKQSDSSLGNLSLISSSNSSKLHERVMKKIENQNLLQNTSTKSCSASTWNAIPAGMSIRQGRHKM